MTIKRFLYAYWTDFQIQNAKDRNHNKSIKIYSKDQGWLNFFLYIYFLKLNSQERNFPKNLPTSLNLYYHVFSSDFSWISKKKLRNWNDHSSLSNVLYINFIEKNLVKKIKTHFYDDKYFNVFDLSS